MLTLLATSAVHLPNLISDLGLILITAAISVLLFRILKQPLVLGYLLAGFLAGSEFDFFPSVQDVNSVKVWAEIGVIFLLFSLGLEFSFKKLVKVGGTASITAITQIIVMITLGFFAGHFMGWNSMNSVFLGVILSISSTTIILKTFDELGVKSQKFAKNVIGSLIVQDIIAILMMVLLSTIAVTQQFSGVELLQSVLKLIFFLTIWFVVGIFFIPTLLKKAKHLLTDEMMLIISLALCLLMVIFAANVGFSPALGAFIMGSIIAETTQAEHIEQLVKPVKDLFGAVFFVSVGMLINPETLVEHALPVTILTFVVILGQSISSTIGALLSGQPLKQSIQTGMSLSQIGEFSFIIATLGTTLNVTSDFLYPIVVAVSAITTFTTPFMVKFAVPFSVYLEKKLPKKWVKRIKIYSANTEEIKLLSNWQIVIKSYVTQVIIHSIIIVAIIILSSKYVLPIVSGSRFGNLVAAFITLGILAPFLWALSLRRVAVTEVEILMEEKKHRGPMIMLVLFRILLTLFYVGFVLNNFFSAGVASVAFLVSIITYILFPKKIHIIYYKIENHFINNFNDREIRKENNRQNTLSPWDGHMAEFEIAKESNLVGKTLEELSIREQFGINIASIQRGEIIINIPKKSERLFPGDEINIIGSDQQVKEFELYLLQNEIDQPDLIKEVEIILQKLKLSNRICIGKSIRDSEIKEKTHGIIVGIERNGKRILNPESDLILQENDILWIAGEKRKIAEFLKA